MRAHMQFGISGAHAPPPSSPFYEVLTSRAGADLVGGTATWLRASRSIHCACGTGSATWTDQQLCYAVFLDEFEK